MIFLEFKIKGLIFFLKAKTILPNKLPGIKLHPIVKSWAKGCPLNWSGKKRQKVKRKLNTFGAKTLTRLMPGMEEITTLVTIRLGKRSQTLLDYLTHQAMSGNGHQLKTWNEVNFQGKFSTNESQWAELLMFQQT